MRIAREEKIGDVYRRALRTAKEGGGLDGEFAKYNALVVTVSNEIMEDSWEATKSLGGFLIDYYVKGAREVRAAVDHAFIALTGWSFGRWLRAFEDDFARDMHEYDAPEPED